MSAKKIIFIALACVGLSVIAIVALLLADTNRPTEKEVLLLRSNIESIDGIDRVDVERLTAGGGLGIELHIRAVGTPNRSPEATQATIRSIVDLPLEITSYPRISFSQQHGSGVIRLDRSTITRPSEDLEIPISALMAEIDAGASDAYISNSIYTHSNINCDATYSTNLHEIEALWNKAISKSSNNCSSMRRTVSIDNQIKLTTNTKGSTPIFSAMPAGTLSSILPYVDSLKLDDSSYSVSIIGSHTAANASDSATINIVNFLRAAQEISRSSSSNITVYVSWSNPELTVPITFRSGHVDMDLINGFKPEAKDSALLLLSLMGK